MEIILFNSRDEIIKKELLSKGEQQLFASSILKALVEESGIEFPVFVDSPMQKFDANHASNVIKFFYPNVSKQVVIFPLLHKELNKNEYQYLLNRISKTYLIHNINPDHSEFIPVKPELLLENHSNIKEYADQDI